jgi:hypothetical protein
VFARAHKANGSIPDDLPSPTWRNLSYTDEIGEETPVGEWTLEETRDQWKVKVKPLIPLQDDESLLLEWLENNLSEYGLVWISETGDIEITCSDVIQLDKLLEQVSYVYHTLQRNEP